MSTRGLNPKKLTAISVAMLFALAACGDDSDDSDDQTTGDDEATEETQPEAENEEASAPEGCDDPDTTFVATADLAGEEVTVYDGPDGETLSTLPTIWSSSEGVDSPTTFVVDEDNTDGHPRADDTDWLHVELPVPDGDGTGYVQASDVSVTCHTYRIIVDRDAFMLTVTNAGESIFEAAVGLGSDERATEEGNYFITDLAQPTDPNGGYGPYAYAFNSYSDDPDVIAEFANDEGRAQAGIHGTNQPDSVGAAESSGCIRLKNEDIGALAADEEYMAEGVEGIGLPLGTPVDVI